MLGFLNIAKPPGITAHDVVSRVRKIAGIKQVGHGGTLDPMATGVLPVALGKACRLLRFLPGDKVYLAEILLGTRTETDDIEGKIIEKIDCLPRESQVLEALKGFVGQQEQTPPLYSAVHYQGQRLYALARQGQAPLPQDLATRAVHIYALEIVHIALPVVQVRISCSAGTYIRSIARDLGDTLGCGACLNSLVREQAGPFKLMDALSLEDFKALAESGQIGKALIAPQEVLPLPRVELDKTQVDSLLLGQSLPGFAPGASTDPPQAVLALSANALVAVCRKTGEGRLQPEVVIGRPD